MKNQLLFIFALINCIQFTYAQKASDVLEKGVHLKNDMKIFLKYENHKILYGVAKIKSDPNNALVYNNILQDSSIFLISENGIGIYLCPLNPLIYTVSTKIVEISNPIDESESATLGSFIDGLQAVSLLVYPKSGSAPSSAPSSQTNVIDTCLNFKKIETNLKSIKNLLMIDSKMNIGNIFDDLKKMQFADEKSTKSDLDRILVLKDKVKNHFDSIKNLSDETDKLIKKYICEKPGGYIFQYIFESIAQDLKLVYIEQKRRFDNLEIAYKLVESTYLLASAGGGDGMGWLIPMDIAFANEGKINVYTIYIKESTYKGSDNSEENVTDKPEEIFTRTIRFEQFRPTIFEASTGIAYTFFTYNTYGTTSDASGQLIVGEPTKNQVKNINITTMANYNIYCRRKRINPLFQFGLGINSEMPTILTGFGIRLFPKEGKRMRLTSGLATTWIKELDKLQVGSEVTGTSDIDKDMKYNAIPRFSLYIGLQFNF